MRRSVVAAAMLVVVAAGAAGVVVLRSSSSSVPQVASSPSPAPIPTRTPLIGAPVVAAPPTSAGLQAALAKALVDPALGARVSLSVIDIASGATVFDRDGARPVTPASTTKIATALAALTVLSPDLRLATRVVQGDRPGDVVLVGGGDPTLGGKHPIPGYPGTASLAGLAAQLKGTVVRRVLVDSSLYSGATLGPGWKPDYVSTGNVAPVTALEVDQGRTSDKGPRTQTPALVAGQELATLLHAPHVLAGLAPPGAKVLATVLSPTVPELVEGMLTRSDNDLAEALGRQIALAEGQPASFAGDVVATKLALAPLLGNVPGLALHDNSGLSPLDKVTPDLIAHLIARAASSSASSSALSSDRYASFLSGLPIGGFDGTLGDRYRKSPTSAAAGDVRAKTGTLDGVSALAGLVQTRTGGLLAFDVTADEVPLGGTSAAEAALDRVATALAGCGCA